ncbi:MAG: CopG family transcriptional regulator [Okeania sp. SIO2D1]|nr:CopG family transcriptional regulator [Okeania sp. SIO2D1]
MPQTAKQAYGEKKTKTSVGFTLTAMTFLDKMAREENLSRSELLERMVREKMEISTLPKEGVPTQAQCWNSLKN